MTSLLRRFPFEVACLLLLGGCTSFQTPPSGGDAGMDRPVDMTGSDQTGSGGAPDGPGRAPDADSGAGCSNTQTDPRNCGVCGHDCAMLANVKAGAAVECRAGVCWVPSGGCADGFAHCTASGNDGCETSVSRPESCGSCTKVCGAGAPLCASSGATQTCVSSCAAPTPDSCGSRCVDLQTDPANCGVCGMGCTFPNAEGACLKGVCSIARCKAGYGDCTTEPGCETPLTTASNCGACGKSCAVTHGGAQCQAGGTCGPVTCETGWGNCDTANPDCESPLTTEAHCGACPTACTGGTPLCATVAGKQTCVSDCTATAPTKCDSKCVNTDSDKNNCGMCGKVCSFPNAEAACVNGQCAMGACKLGFGDCTTQPGCETPLDSQTNCGRCGNACSFANATSSCDGTQCTTPVCKNGYANCETSSPDCETAVNTPTNCGRCGASCPAQTPLCSSSTGIPTCVSDCSPSTPTKCGTTCVNTVTDPQNCNMCGKVCSAPNADSGCAGSQCTFTCKSGYGDCTAQAGCETPLNTDSNCGACGVTCTFANATSSCTGSTCSTPVCKSNFDNCNKASADCETNLQSDGHNCGTCGHDCLGGACISGTCQAISIFGPRPGRVLAPQVDATNVYFIHETRSTQTQTFQNIGRERLDGSNFIDLLQNDIESIGWLTLDESFVYWPAYKPGEIRACQLPDCVGGYRVVVPNQILPREVYVDVVRHRTFWTSETNPNWTIMTNPAAPSPIGSPGGVVFELNSDGTYLYYVSNDSSLRRISINGGTPTSIASGFMFASLLRLTSGEAFVGGRFQDASGKSWPAIFKVSIPDGGIPILVGYYPGGEAALLQGMALDSQFVYWLATDYVANDTVHLVRCPRSGCGNKPTHMANLGGPCDGGGMALSSDAVFWAACGQLFKIAK